jgi:hypothetical protein
MRCLLFAIPFILAGACADFPLGAGPCHHRITSGQTSVEVTLEGRTPSFDVCADSVPLEHYAWLRRNEQVQVRITAWRGGKEYTPRTLEYAFLDRPLDGQVFKASNGGKLMVRVDSQFYSNFLYVAIVDSIRRIELGPIAGLYDVTSSGGTGKWSMSGALTLDDPGGILRYEQCPSYDVTFPSPVPESECSPSLPSRTFPASFIGQVCDVVTGACTSRSLSGTATLDTLRQVQLCIGQLTQFGVETCDIRNLNPAPIVADTIRGFVNQGPCSGRTCGSGLLTGIRRKQ